MTPYFCGFTICYFVCRASWGVGQAEPGAFCITATATCDWYNGHQRGGDWHKPASTEGYAQNVPSKWRRAKPPVNWLGSLWRVPLMLPQNWVSFTAVYAEKTFRCSLMAVRRSSATFRGSGILRGISGCDLRLLGGVSLGLMASL